MSLIITFKFPKKKTMWCAVWRREFSLFFCNRHFKKFIKYFFRKKCGCDFEFTTVFLQILRRMPRCIQFSLLFISFYTNFAVPLFHCVCLANPLRSDFFFFVTVSVYFCTFRMYDKNLFNFVFVIVFVSRDLLQFFMRWLFYSMSVCSETLDSHEAEK